MKLLSHKESKVISEKYFYSNKELDWIEKTMEFEHQMKREGWKKTGEKFANNGYVVTYIKYTSL